MTVNDVIVTAMQLIGALSTGQTPSADDAALCFANLNAMLDGWNAERLNLYTTIVFSGNLLNTQQVYQMGPSAADFNTAAPVLIQTATVIIPTTTVRYPVKLVNSVEWSQLTEKGLTGFLPDKLYCDYAWPIANLNVHPIPNHTIALELYLWSILAQFANLTDTVNFRPGYLEAIQYNLAVKIAPQFGLAQDQTNVQLALGYKEKMRQLNEISGIPQPPAQQFMPPSTTPPAAGAQPPQQ